jgi:hypothetical protein
MAANTNILTAHKTATTKFSETIAKSIKRADDFL